MSPRPPASIKVRALQWLAQREHSRAELRGKLLRLLAGQDDLLQGDAHDDRDDAAAAAAAQVDALLDWLVLQGHLSQERFVESRVHARQSRFGNLRIRRELQLHGVALDPQAQQALEDSELERARSVWRKKFGQTAADAAGRVRQMRFLSGRGFSSEVVRRIVRGGDDDAA